MANKVFVFCIGGTGLRVMKAITMLAASGVKTNGYSIVPIIIDPHIDLEEKTKVDNLINDYISIYKYATTSEGQQMNPLDGFFNTQFQRLAEIDDEQNNTSASMAERRTFGEYMNVGNLSNDDVNNFLVQTLFSKENLTNSLSVGFKGNPNIGTVVLNEMVNGTVPSPAIARMVTGFSLLAPSLAAPELLVILSSRRKSRMLKVSPPCSEPLWAL